MTGEATPASNAIYRNLARTRNESVDAARQRFPAIDDIVRAYGRLLVAIWEHDAKPAQSTPSEPTP